MDPGLSDGSQRLCGVRHQDIKQSVVRGGRSAWEVGPSLSVCRVAFTDPAVSLQVEYQCEGFLEKNRDTVYEEQINILKASQVRTRTRTRTRTTAPAAVNTSDTFILQI